MTAAKCSLASSVTNGNDLEDLLEETGLRGIGWKRRRLSPISRKSMASSTESTLYLQQSHSTDCTAVGGWPPAEGLQMSVFTTGELISACTATKPNCSISMHPLQPPLTSGTCCHHMCHICHLREADRKSLPATTHTTVTRSREAFHFSSTADRHRQQGRHIRTK